MSQFDDDEFEGNENFADLRKAYNALKKVNKGLETELGSFRTDSRKRALTGAIEAAGLNPKIAAFVPTDVDTEGIVEWLKEYGEVFAPAGATPPVAADAPPVAAPDGAQQFNDVANTGTPPNGDVDQQLALVQGATTLAELDALIGYAR
jgi:hypothetical protein